MLKFTDISVSSVLKKIVGFIPSRTPIFMEWISSQASLRLVSALSFSSIISKAELAWLSLVWAVDVPCWKPELTAAEGTGAVWQCMWTSVRGCCCCLHASQQETTQKIHSLVLVLQACPHLLVSSTTLIIITIYQVFSIYMHDKLSIKMY